MKKLILLTLLLAAAAHAQIPQHLNYQGRVAVQGTNFHGTGQFKFALVVPTGDTSQAAVGYPVLANGAIVAVAVTPSGSGYAPPPAAPPVVTFGGDGTGATGTAVVAPDGSIASITIDQGGTGYNAVTMTIAPPPPNIQYFTSWSNDQTSMSGSEPTASVSLPVTNGLYSVSLGDTAAGMEVINPGVFSTAVQLRVWFSDGVNGFQQLTPDQPLGAAPYAFRASLAEDVPFSSITSDEIAEGAVVSASLAPGAVTETKLAPGAVTAAKLAPGAVNGAALSAGAVSSANLATNAVTADKLAPGAVTGPALAAGAVVSNLAPGAVTSDLLAPGAARANLNLGGNQNVDLGHGDFASVSVFGGVEVVGAVQIYDDLLVDEEIYVDGVIVANGGIGTTGLAVTGDITYVGTLTDISDARLKDLGAPFTAGLDTIAKIEPLHYRFKLGNALGAPSDAVHVGVSAQALQAALPEAVVQRSDGYLGVSQEPVLWALVNAVKELQAENEALRDRVESLEADRP